MKKAFSIEIISSFFILLFVYTAVSKLLNLDNFRFVLSLSPLLKNLAPFVSWLIPISELIIALLLFIPRTRLLGLYASFVMMSIFTLYIGYMLVFTVDRPCNCGGILKEMTWNQHLVFNIGCTILAAIGILLLKKMERQKYKSLPAFL